MARWLLIEDREDRAEQIVAMMTFAMHECDVMSNGATALEYLRGAEVLPDGIMMNVIMPQMDGFSVAREIKQTSEWMHTPIIAIGDDTDSDDTAALAQRAGISEFIRRPLTRDKVLEAIDKTLLMADLQENPLQNPSPLEEQSFLRDYNTWLTKKLHHATAQRDTAVYEKDLHGAHVSALQTLTNALGEDLDLDATVKRLVEQTANIMRVQLAALYIPDDVPNRFRLTAVQANGIPTPQLAEAVNFQAAHPLEPLKNNPMEPIIFDSGGALAELTILLDINIKLQAVMVSPLVERNALGGFLILGRVSKSFTPQDSDMMLSLAGAEGLALRSANLFHSLSDAYDDLQELDKRKSEFVAITSHELRTPLAILLGYTNMLSDMEDDPAKHNQLLTIEKQAKFLSGMVDALLDLREITDENNHVRIACRPIQLDTFLQEALDALRQHGNHEHTVTFEIDCDPIQIVGDDVRLMLLLNNLFDNAYKFSPDGSIVRIVGVEPPGGGAIISVKDQGIGIDNQYLEQIFAPFFQIEDAMTRRYGGLGVGLAIVKGMVDLHDGTIEVISELDEGTEFIITLPAAPPPERCRSWSE